MSLKFGLTRWAGLARFTPLMLLITLSTISGCTVMRKPTEQTVGRAELEQKWQQHQAQVRALDNWSIDGRVGIKSPEHSGSVGLVWEQNPITFSLYMTGPLGQSVARLRGAVVDENQQTVVLHVPDSEPLISDSAQQLLYEQTGWLIPFQALQDWVRGMPMQGEEFLYALNDKGLLEKLEQDGWIVEYSRYSQIDGVDLPGRIRANKEGTTVIVSVRKWTIMNW